MSTVLNLGRIQPIFKGDYSSSETYGLLDLVVFSGITYIAKENNITGTFDGSKWQALAEISQLINDSVASTVSTYSSDKIETTFIDNLTNEQIDGIKTFLNSPVVPTPTSNTDAANKSYVDGEVSTIGGQVSTLDGQNVKLTGNQTIAGVKTFSDPISGSGQNLTNLNASNVTSGTLADARIPNLNASKITAGQFATARLGSGTGSTSNFLRGDGSWQAVPSSAPTTAQVLSATAGASAGAVGTYAALRDTNTAVKAAGATRPGSGLRFTNFNGNDANASASGTWRLMGAAGISGWSSGVMTSSVWLRIA